MTSKSRAILAAFLWILHFVAGRELQGRAQVRTSEVVPMYTRDYVRDITQLSVLSDFVMRVSALHGIDEEAPMWDTEFSLKFENIKSMEGFIAMEYTQFDPTKQTLDEFLDHDQESLCYRREDIETGAETEWTGSEIEFIDWEYDSSVNPNAPNHLDFNFTYTVQETGIWMSIIHLCVTEEEIIWVVDPNAWTLDYMRPVVTMEGDLTALNPLGQLGGDLIVALPVLFSVGALWTEMAVIWSILMIRFRSKLIPSVHWTLLIGILLLIAQTAWQYSQFWSLNVYGYQSPSFGMMIVSQFISNIMALYTRIILLILSTGTGIARPSLGKHMMRFLTIYGFIFCVVNGRIEWINFSLSSTRWSYDDNEFELVILIKLLKALNFVFVMMMCFNVRAVFVKLEKENQLHKKTLFLRLTKIGVVSICGAIAIYIATMNADRMMDFTDPNNWVIVYFFDDGFWRLFHLMMSFSVLLVLKPRDNLSKMAYSVKVPLLETQDVEAAGDVTTGATQQNKESSWDDMLAAIRESGPLIMKKIRRSDE